MIRKSLSAIGIILLLLITNSCSSKPEEGILKSYFHAVKLKDMTTLSTLALKPISPEVKGWEIISTNEEVVKPATLPDLNQKELELKKKVEESVFITLDASDELDNAKFELENARTRSARRAAQKKVEEEEVEYREVRERHGQLQKDYSEAKAAAAREEEITSFSLRTGMIQNIRELTGNVRFKEAEIEIEAASGTKRYKCYMRKYELRDEVTNVSRRGRWIILEFEPIK